MNEMEAAKVAVDIPSGIDSSTGGGAWDGVPGRSDGDICLSEDGDGTVPARFMQETCKSGISASICGAAWKDRGIFPMNGRISKRSAPSGAQMPTKERTEES